MDTWIHGYIVTWTLSLSPFISTLRLSDTGPRLSPDQLCNTPCQPCCCISTPLAPVRELAWPVSHRACAMRTTTPFSPQPKAERSTNSLTEMEGPNWTYVIPKKARERLQCRCAVAWTTVDYSPRYVWNVALERSQQRDRFCAAATWIVEPGEILGLRSVQREKGILDWRAPGHVESGNKIYVLTAWGRSCRSNAASVKTGALVASAVENRALSIP